jgi:hypothetical protein
MKKIICMCLVVVFACFAVAMNVEAISTIKVSGWANPYAGTVTDNGTTTTFGKVDYSFNVVDSLVGSAMDGLDLAFEFDVFESYGALQISNPIDWNIGSQLDFFGAKWQLTSAGATVVEAGQELAFSVLDVVVYNNALDPYFVSASGQCVGAACWDEGGIWEQNFQASSTSPMNDSGYGSSTMPTPEPGTFLLVGLGIVGVVLYARKKKCLISI